MASTSLALKPCSISIKIFDGSRQPIPQGVEVLITILDGNQKQVYRDFSRGPELSIQGLPFFDNFGDNYTVVAWASGYDQAGFTPVKVSPRAPAVVDIMLLRKDADYNFSQSRWDALKLKWPGLVDILSAGASDESAARDRFTDLMENRPEVLACFFNATTVMSQIHLPSKSPLDYVRELFWDETMQEDRFFAWADRQLVAQVRQAAEDGEFEPEPGTAIFHPGATSSFKQVEFGEANLQLTFHENDTNNINGVDCIKIEPDIDYYKDPLAHALLEAIPNRASGTLTDPRQVYVLRWIAGRHAGVQEFDPPYTII
jgi:hypothetical protein